MLGRKEGVHTETGVGVRAHRTRVASVQAGSHEGTGFPLSEKAAPDTERKTEHESCGVDWDPRCWTCMFSQPFALANRVVMSNLVYPHFAQILASYSSVLQDKTVPCTSLTVFL